MKRFIKVLLLCVAGCFIAAFAVANREHVKFYLDPLNPVSDRSLVSSVEAPLFVFLFIAMFLGIFLGAAAVWLGQGHWRKAARARSKEAAQWKREAETLKAGLQAAPSGSGMPLPQRQIRSYL